MIRKTIIGVLTLGAVGTLSLFLLSSVYQFGYGSSSFFFGIARGELALGFGDAPFDRGWLWEQTTTSYPMFSLPMISNRGGGLSIAIPLWLIFLVLAAAFVRARRRRRRKGLCLSCGYDLTGNESGVCSECGSEVEKP